MAKGHSDDNNRKPESSEPTDDMSLKSILWNQLVSEISHNHAPIEEAWNFTGNKSGWSLRLKRNDRNVLYMIPQVDHFLVGIFLGEKAVVTALKSGLPSPVVELIEKAQTNAEGRGVRIPVSKPEDLVVVQKLVAAKLSS